MNTEPLNDPTFIKALDLWRDMAHCQRMKKFQLAEAQRLTAEAHAHQDRANTYRNDFYELQTEFNVLLENYFNPPTLELDGAELMHDHGIG